MKAPLFGRIAIYLTCLCILSSLLVAVWRYAKSVRPGSPLKNLIYYYVHCPVEDEEAIEAALVFCGKFGLPCQGKPTVRDDYTSPLILLIPQDRWFRKSVNFTAYRVAIKCENMKIASVEPLWEVKFDKDRLYTSLPLQKADIANAYNKYINWLTESGIADCSLITDYGTGRGNFSLTMRAISKQRDWLNLGHAVFDQRSGGIISYKIEITHWCGGEMLPEPYDRVVNLIDALEIGEEALKQKMKLARHSKELFVIDKVMLFDQHYANKGIHWHVGFRNVKANAYMVFEADRYMHKIDGLKEDFLKAELPNGSPVYMTVIIDALTGRVLDLDKKVSHKDSAKRPSDRASQ